MPTRGSRAADDRPSVREALEAALDEAPSVDVFVHELMGFVVELSRRHPGHPVVASLGEHLSKAAASPFVAAAMHDLRSILQGVYGSLEYAPRVLHRSGLLDPARVGPADPARLAQLLEALDDARTGTRTAAELAREAFEVHRSSIDEVAARSKAHSVRLNRLVETTARLASCRAPVDVELDTSERLEVVADPSRVLRVLGNLLNNAAQALDELEDPTGARVRVATWASDEFAFVQVADDGPGIPAATRTEIFDLFFTTRGEGSGIGLYVCKVLVNAWGGMIHVDSRDGEGARFTFSVPLSTTATASPPRS